MSLLMTTLASEEQRPQRAADCKNAAAISGSLSGQTQQAEKQMTPTTLQYPLQHDILNGYPEKLAQEIKNKIFYFDRFAEA